MNINALGAQVSPVIVRPFRAAAQTVKSDRTLQGIVQKMVDTYESTNRAARIKGQAIELASYVSAGLDEEMTEKQPKEVLEMYLHNFGFMKAVAANGIHVLNEVKDGLTACDQAAADYQDILDGNTELPEDLTREDVERLADITRKQREKYVRAGNKMLDSSLGVFCAFSGTLRRTFGEDPFEGKNLEVQLDVSNSTEDILSCIDEATGRLSNGVGVLDEGISLVAKELEKQNGLDEKIRKYIQMLSSSIDSSTYYSSRHTLASVLDMMDIQDQRDEAVRTGNYVDHGSYIEFNTYG